MANDDIVDQTDVSLNYIGPLFVLGANQTPCLNMIGGLNGYRPCAAFNFPVTVYASLDSAAQTVVSEDTAIAGSSTARTYDKAQAYNTIQTMLRIIEVSYAKLSDRNTLSGLAISNVDLAVQNELDFQTEMALRQLAVDLEFSILQGQYVARSNSAAEAKTRGLVGTGANGAIQTNRVNAGSAALTTANINSLVKSMADNGAPFRNPVMFVNSFQKQKISALYGWAPVAAPGNGLGGTAVQVIETDFARIPVVFAPKALNSTVTIAEMSELTLRGLPVPGKGAVFREPLAKTAASEKYQLYAQLGLDYGEESHHGVIYGLTTS